MNTLGIRREDKNKWERRVPLIPVDAAAVAAAAGVRVLVEPSPIRVFTDDDYAAAGVPVDPAAVSADVLVAVKEIPIALFRPGGVYVCFAHVIKGQRQNMPALQALLDRGCTLVDYERIADDAGLRLRGRGLDAPLAEIKPAYEYADLGDAERHIRAIGRRLRTEDLPGGRPLTLGISGYGNVSRGAQKVLEWLPVDEVEPENLPVASSFKPLVKVVFMEKDMVRPAGDHAFELQDYFDHPERYEGRFADHLPHLDLLLNTIFWTDRYPRLVTKDWAAAQFADGGESRLQVIGDISIDIEGSIELSHKATYADAPCFVYDPVTGRPVDGVDGRGICVMAVDNLPCELPREASEHFSGIFRDMAADLARCDWTAEFDDLDLPPHLKRAVIVHRSALCPAYRYLAGPLARHLEA